MYLYGQDRDEGACVQPNSNILDRVHNEIMSESKLETINNFHTKPWEFFPEYSQPKGMPEPRMDYYSFHGWNGLRKLFPFIDRDENVECLVTRIFERKDVAGCWDEAFEIEQYNRDDEFLKLFNFHCEADIWAVSDDNGEIMLSKKENNLDWNKEEDEDWVKWDCYDRNEGGFIGSDSPLYPLFPASREDNGVGIPYKVHVIVDAVV